MVHPVITTSARPHPPVPPGASSLAPLPSVAVVPTLHASHYLYYQHVEKDPEGDTVASGGGGGGDAPSSALGAEVPLDRGRK